MMRRSESHVAMTTVDPWFMDEACSWAPRGQAVQGHTRRLYSLDAQELDFVQTLT
jgi:hypothetical protein